MSRGSLKHIVAVCAIIRYGAKILCTKRNDTGQWEFPGGKVEDAESYSDALVREIREELGIDIIVGEQLQSATMTFETATVTLIPFKCECIEKPKSSTDHSELMWLEKSELMQLDWMPLDIPIVNQL